MRIPYSSVKNFYAPIWSQNARKMHNKIKMSVNIGALKIPPMKVCFRTIRCLTHMKVFSCVKNVKHITVKFGLMENHTGNNKRRSRLMENFLFLLGSRELVCFHYPTGSLLKTEMWYGSVLLLLLCRWWNFFNRGEKMQQQRQYVVCYATKVDMGTFLKKELCSSFQHRRIFNISRRRRIVHI